MNCCKTPFDNVVCWTNALAAFNIGLCALGVFDFWKVGFIMTPGLGYPLMLLVGLSGAWFVGHSLWHMFK